jgi:Fe-S-cluster-containing dehydrogenase component
MLGRFDPLNVERKLKSISVDEAVCSGCLACEVACVVQHEGVFGTSSARICVEKSEEDGLDEPHVCLFCNPAPCIDSCPTIALYRDDLSGLILLSEEECTGCSVCVDACPFGAIWLHPVTMVALICDLCGGDPACVKRCVTGAIVFTDEAPQRFSEL